MLDINCIIQVLCNIVATHFKWIKNVTYIWKINPFHISMFLSSGSRHSWLTSRAVNGRLPHIYFFAFPFAQIAKEKLHYNVFMTFKKRGKKLRETHNGSQKRERCQIDRSSHRRCIRNTLALELTSLFDLIQRWYNTKYNVINIHTFLKTSKYKKLLRIYDADDR